MYASISIKMNEIKHKQSNKLIDSKYQKKTFKKFQNC